MFVIRGFKPELITIIFLHHQLKSMLHQQTFIKVSQLVIPSIVELPINFSQQFCNSIEACTCSDISYSLKYKYGFIRCSGS